MLWSGLKVVNRLGSEFVRSLFLKRYRQLRLTFGVAPISTHHS